MQAVKTATKANRSGLLTSVTYGFLILAAFLMLADCYRLVRAPMAPSGSVATAHLAGI